MSLSRFCSLYAALGRDLELDLSRDIPLLAKWESSEGLLNLVRRLSSLGDAVDAALISGGALKIPPFIACIESLPRLFHGAFKKVFLDSGVLDSNASPDDVYHLRQLLKLNSKLNLPSLATASETWKGFKERQESLRLLRLPESPILRRMREIAHRQLKNLDLASIYPKHGPGAVSEGLLHDEKYAFPSWFSPAERAYPRWLYGRPVFGSTYIPPTLGKATTRVVTVPKDWKKVRLISVEPASQQFLQQGQMNKMYSYLDHCVLGRFCSVTDQTRNRHLAKYPGFDTLDLSDASDYISAALVAYLFPKGLRRLLFATRSVEAAFDGETVRLYSFAPMGSANCFPVETIVFTLAIMAVWDYIYPQDRGFSLECSVFGDDLVVPSDISEIVAEFLRSLGMRINFAKSCFSNSPFRESCGAEYFKGADVSITRNKNFLYDTPTKDNLLSILALQRELYKKDLRRTAEYLLSLSRAVFPVPVSETLDCPEGFANGPTDFSVCRMRYNKDYQRHEVLAPRLVRSRRRWTAIDEQYLFSRLLGDSSEFVPTRGRKTSFGWCSALEKS